MNSIDLTPLYRSSIGFDRMASLLNSAFSADSSTSGYPPYDIEILEDNQYTITLAVAGFAQGELEIKVERGVLSVRGGKNVDEERHYLYQGIANRTFERKFNLADYVEVTGADLSNGLLTISLVKEVPEAMKPRSIKIGHQSEVLEHQKEEKSGGDADQAA
jgi:molecular chaperone IbpA